MKHAVLFFLLMSLPAAFAQQPSSRKSSQQKAGAKTTTTRKASTVAANSGTSKTKPKPVSTPVPLSEKEQFQKASGLELASERVAALESFLTAFPESADRPAAIDLLVSSRVLIAEEKILSGDSADAVAIFRRVVEQLPRPVPNELFAESVGKIPSTLFFRGQRAAAIELAGLIETKVEDNAAQLVEIANFHLSTENGAEAMRVAAKAAAKDPSSAAVQRTIALAHRINFDLDLSADAYAKSLELDPNSVASKRGLAEMKRALGKSEEALALYRELLAKNDGDVQSRTGMILSMFDAGKRSEAEDELTKALAQSPGNIVLMAGAAYWYASKGIGDKAVELAEKAIAREPRYVWSHIALARGLISQRKPVEAEQVLVKARTYGNFPTLEYELASARVAAGFYREAAEDLQKQFSVTSTGAIRTNLGGRVVREEKNLAELAGFERKASIFAPVGADSAEISDALKNLLILEHKLQEAQPNETDVAAAVDTFTAGSDKMKLHRQMYAASLLLRKRIALGKVLELARAATGNTDAGLAVANPRAAVMASELYEARMAAFRKNEFLVVPDIPNQTLSSILRGRVEELSGWALYQQNNFPDAIVRLKRAISVMPDKSAWWRSSMWRLGAAQAADGKDAEALASYIESYKTDQPDFAKYAVVEALYRKVNGNTEGLEAKIGRDRVVAASAGIEEPKPAPATETPATVNAEVAPAGTSSPVPPVSDSTPEPVKTEPAKSEAAPIEKVVTPAVKIDPPAVEKEIKAVEKTDPLPTTESLKPATEEKEPKVKADPPPDTKAPDTKAPEAAVPETKVEPTPEEKIPETKVEPKTEPKTDQADEVKPVETKSDPAEAKTDTPKTVRTDNKPAAAKPLFEPIIINIPNSRPAKKEGEAAKLASANDRPRVIDGQEVKQDEIAPCTIGASQDNLSVINNGGSVGILINVDAPGDAKELVAASSSPKDVELTLQPEIGGVADRRFFVIKSVSTSLGVYQINFTTPCGKKVVLVTVR